MSDPDSLASHGEGPAMSGALEDDIELRSADLAKLIDAVTLAFKKPADAEGLLLRIEFPRGRVPNFTVDHRYAWNQVFQDLEAGVITTPYRRLLDAAVRVYPYQVVLRQLAERYGVVSPGPVQPAPEPPPVESGQNADEPKSAAGDWHDGPVAKGGPRPESNAETASHDPESEKEDCGVGASDTLNVRPNSTPRSPSTPDAESTYRKSGFSTGSIATATGIWSALCSLPLVTISTLSISFIGKLIWYISIALLGIIAVAIIKIVVAITSVSNGRRPGAVIDAIRHASRNTQITLPALGVAFLIVLIITFPLANSEEARIAAPPGGQLVNPEETKTVFPPGCPGIEVGAGNPDYASAFRAAYQRRGGIDKLGCAQNEVTRVDSGVHQNLQKGGVASAIFATEPKHVVVLENDFHAGFRSIGDDDGMKSIGLACYPIDEGVRLAEGFKLEVGAGGCRLSAVIKKDGDQWFWVQPAIWEVYDQKYGGPEGVLGYPTDKAVPVTGTADLKQTFEHGALCIENGAVKSC